MFKTFWTFQNNFLLVSYIALQIPTQYDFIWFYYLENCWRHNYCLPISAITEKGQTSLVQFCKIFHIELCYDKVGYAIRENVIFPWDLLNRGNCRKSSVEECIFYWIALYVEGRFNNNSLLMGYANIGFPFRFQE